MKMRDDRIRIRANIRSLCDALLPGMIAMGASTSHGLAEMLSSKGRLGINACPLAPAVVLGWLLDHPNLVSCDGEMWIQRKQSSIVDEDPMGSSVVARVAPCPRRRRRSHLAAAEILALTREAIALASEVRGSSVERVALRLGVKPYCVYRRILRAGVHIRGPHATTRATVSA